MKWKEELFELKHASMKASTPNAYEASGGRDMKIKAYTDTTTNGLTRCIIEFLQFKGHYANRINTQGQAREKSYQKFNIHSGKLQKVSNGIQWTPGSTRKGTPDIDAIINGRPVKVEVKVGKDSQSDDQIEEQGKIINAGGYYFIAKDMELFYNWYYETFETV